MKSEASQLKNHSTCVHSLTVLQVQRTNDARLNKQSEPSKYSRQGQGKRQSGVCESSFAPRVFKIRYPSSRRVRHRFVHQLLERRHLDRRHRDGCAIINNVPLQWGLVAWRGRSDVAFQYGARLGVICYEGTLCSARAYANARVLRPLPVRTCADCNRFTGPPLWGC